MRFCSPLVFFEKLEENFQIDGIPYQRIDYTCQGDSDKYTLSGVNTMKISYIAPERVYFLLFLRGQRLVICSLSFVLFKQHHALNDQSFILFFKVVGKE